ncbi:hypothetical protein I2I05_11820 [Hymenobacter sp. BT683]|uniref:Uncharacterized protein n=1 Tax=Hymenobacter jeongseonensis TaxID=2791027 RepID=A0ABS0II93_9BACT|nr:hypothetical protein [Hymenobacter jeongseonensis]MBF9238083.1 hypothetical protein [Hymenobacter jeongseonensis]
MSNVFSALFFANYYGFDKLSREGGTPTAAYCGELLCTQQVVLVTTNVVYGVAPAFPHECPLKFGVVAAACAVALFANYFGVIKSARYPAFRTRLDRQPFAVKLALVLFAVASSVVAIPGCVWLMERYCPTT